jgi:hypothetical protein
MDFATDRACPFALLLGRALMMGGAALQRCIKAVFQVRLYR